MIFICLFEKSTLILRRFQSNLSNKSLIYLLAYET